MPASIFGIIGFVLIFGFSLSLFWEAFSLNFRHGEFKYKNGRNVLPEHIFDIWFLSSLLAVFAARLSYVLLNLSEFSSKWSFIPWVRDDEGKVIWLTRFPWVFVNLIDGLDISVFILSMFVLIAVFCIFKGFKPLQWATPLMKGIFGLAAGLQVLALFFTIEGFSKLTLLDPQKYLANIQQSLFFIVGFLCSILYFILVRLYFNKSKDLRLKLLIFSIYLSLILVTIKINQTYLVDFMYFAPLPLLFGLANLVFSKDLQQNGITSGEFSSSGRLMPKVKLEVAGLRKPNGLRKRKKRAK